MFLRKDKIIFYYFLVTVQSQADLSKKSDECLHSRALFCINLFGGYASPRKHIVFSRLALNDLFLPRCVSEATVQYHRHVYSIRNSLFIRFSVTLVKPEKPLKVPKIKDSYKSVRCSATIVSTCRVKGNISYGEHSFIRYPCLVKYFRSLASVSGPQDT